MAFQAYVVSQLNFYICPATESIYAGLCRAQGLTKPFDRQSAAREFWPPKNKGLSIGFRIYLFYQLETG